MKYLLLLILLTGCAKQKPIPMDKIEQARGMMYEAVWCWNHGAMTREDCYALYGNQIGVIK